jgi:hypothetical protein
MAHGRNAVMAVLVTMVPHDRVMCQGGQVGVQDRFFRLVYRTTPARRRRSNSEVAMAVGRGGTGLHRRGEERTTRVVCWATKTAQELHVPIRFCVGGCLPCSYERALDGAGRARWRQGQRHHDVRWTAAAA